MNVPASVNVAPVAPKAPPAGAPRLLRTLAPGTTRDALLVCAAGLLLFFWRLGSHDLWPPDEPRFANVAREMAARGDFIVLSLNDRLYTDKPPLFFWIVNAFGALGGGVNEWTIRLPSAVAGVVSLLLVLRLGTRLFGAGTGVLAALVFATSLQIADRARWGSIDMLLNAFVLGAIVLLWRARERERGAFGGATGALPAAAAVAALRDRRTAWVLMGCATLAKGPVGLVLPLLAIVPLLLFDRDRRAAARTFPVSGIVLYLAVTLAWFGWFAHRIGVEPAWDVLVHQNVDRYLDAPNAVHPVWFYVWRFPAGFFPWIVFLPSAIASAFASQGREARRRAVFLCGWIAAIFLFFSFSTGKRGVYIIPLYAAASILVARLFTAAAENPQDARRLRPALWLWLAVALGLAGFLPWVAASQDARLVAPAVVVVAILLAGTAAAIFAAARARPRWAAASLVAAFAAIVLVVVERALPPIDAYHNLRGFAERAQAVLPPGVPIGAVRAKRDAWVFYTARFVVPLDTTDAVRAFFVAGGPRRAFVDGGTLARVRASLPPDVHEALRGRVGEDDFVVLAGGGP